MQLICGQRAKEEKVIDLADVSSRASARHMTPTGPERNNDQREISSVGLSCVAWQDG